MKQRWALLLGSTLGSIALGCSTDGDVTRVGDQPDDNALTGLGREGQALITPCRYEAVNRQMTVLLAAGEEVVLAASGGFVRANGADCTTAVPSADVQRIDIRGSDGDERVTLDFSAGPFAFPTTAAPGLGINVNLDAVATPDPAVSADRADAGADAGGEAASAAAASDAGAGAAHGPDAGTRDRDALVIVLGADNERVTLGAEGISIVTPAAPLSDAFRDISFLGVEILSVRLGDGNDTFSASGSGNPDLGGPFLPQIGLSILGGGGDDTFLQGPIATLGEHISGGSGNDVVDYSARSAAVRVSLAPATVDSPDDGDPIAGEHDAIVDDVEVVRGGAGNDTLSGGNNADVLEGGPGEDRLSGGLGADRLVGGDGRDWFFEDAASNGADTFAGGAGIDTLDYSARVAAISVSMDGISANDGDASGESDMALADIENLIGGSGNDTLVGNASNNVLSGGPGNDVVVGGAGSDTLSYASATSAVNARLPDLALAAASTGNGTLGENDSIDASIENLTGGSADDHLSGNQDANELTGGSGNDTLIGGAGDDVLEGGPIGNAEANWLECGGGDDIGYSQGSAPAAVALDCEL